MVCWGSEKFLINSQELDNGKDFGYWSEDNGKILGFMSRKVTQSELYWKKSLGLLHGDETLGGNKPTRNRNPDS